VKKNELGVFVGLIFRENFGLFGVGFTNGIGWMLRENYGTLGKV